MTDRQVETFYDAKNRLNAALKPYGLRVDCLTPWHNKSWDLYQKQGDRYVLVGLREDTNR